MIRHLKEFFDDAKLVESQKKVFYIIILEYCLRMVNSLLLAST